MALKRVFQKSRDTDHIDRGEDCTLDTFENEEMSDLRRYSLDHFQAWLKDIDTLGFWSIFFEVLNIMNSDHCDPYDALSSPKLDPTQQRDDDVPHLLRLVRSKGYFGSVSQECAVSLLKKLGGTAAEMMKLISAPTFKPSDYSLTPEQSQIVAKLSPPLAPLDTGVAFSTTQKEQGLQTEHFFVHSINKHNQTAWVIGLIHGFGKSDVAATLAKQKLFQLFCVYFVADTSVSVSDAMKKALQTLQQQIELQKCDDGDSGCTIAVAIVVKTPDGIMKVHTLNLGVTEMIRMRGESCKVLTQCHSVNSVAEWHRVARAGASATPESGRLGNVQMMRALGNYNSNTTGLISVPFCSISNLRSTDVLVLGTGAYWKALSPQDTVYLAQSSAQESTQGMADCLKDEAQKASAWKSECNFNKPLSVVVVNPAKLGNK